MSFNDSFIHKPGWLEHTNSGENQIYKMSDWSDKKTITDQTKDIEVLHYYYKCIIIMYLSVSRVCVSVARYLYFSTD